MCPFELVVVSPPNDVESLTPVTMSMTLYGGRVFAEGDQVKMRSSEFSQSADMTGVLIKRGYCGHRCAHRERPCEDDARYGAMCLQAKGVKDRQQASGNWGEAWDRVPCGLRRTHPAGTLISGLRPPVNSCCVGCPACGLGHGSPRTHRAAGSNILGPWNRKQLRSPPRSQT